MLQASVASAAVPLRRSTRERRVPLHLLPATAATSSSPPASSSASSLGLFADGDSSSSISGARTGRSGRPNKRRPPPLSPPPACSPSPPPYALTPPPPFVVEQDAERAALDDVDSPFPSSPFAFSKRLRLPSTAVCAVSFPVLSLSPFPLSYGRQLSSPPPSPCFLPLMLKDTDPGVDDAFFGGLSEPSSPACSVAESTYSFRSTSTLTSRGSASVLLGSPSAQLFPLSRSLVPPQTVSAVQSAPELPRCPYPKTKAGLHQHDVVRGRSLYHYPSPGGVSAAEAVSRVFAALAFAVYCTGQDVGTVLGKWPATCAAWDGFDVAAVAQYGTAEEARLLQDKALIRSRIAVVALIDNARVIAKMESARPGAFLDLLWAPHSKGAVPEAERVLPRPSTAPSACSASEALEAIHYGRQRGAVTVADGGTVTPSILALKLALSGAGIKRMGGAGDSCLLFAQLVGLVNHHAHSCFAHAACEVEYVEVLRIRAAARTELTA